MYWVNPAILSGAVRGVYVVRPSWIPLFFIGGKNDCLLTLTYPPAPRLCTAAAVAIGPFKCSLCTAVSLHLSIPFLAFAVLLRTTIEPHGTTDSQIAGDRTMRLYHVARTARMGAIPMEIYFPCSVYDDLKSWNKGPRDRPPLACIRLFKNTVVAERDFAAVHSTSV